MRASQREIPIVAALKSPDRVPDQVVASFGDYEETVITYAVRWAWENRRIRDMTQARAAELIGLTAPHFSNILTGKKYLPAHKINSFESVVGNTAVSQTLQRFRELRSRDMATQIAQLVADNLVRAA